MKKKIILSIATIAAVTVLTGCGGGDSSSSSNNNQLPESTVKVVDGYVIGANVCDGNNVCATTNAQGEATARFDMNTSLHACGGYIDVNYNGAVDDADIAVPNDKCLAAPAGSTVITPMTLLISAGANPAKLSEVTGIEVAALGSDPIATNNVELAKALQITFAVMVEGKLSDFVNKINSYTGEENEENTSNGSSNTTVLPVIKADENATATATAGNLETFANLAKEVLTSETAKAFVDEVMATAAENAADVEAQVASDKKQMAAEVSGSASENTGNEETNTTNNENNTTEDNTNGGSNTSGGTTVLPNI